MSNIEKAKTIIEKSGNTFHSKVRRYFAENGWYTLVSPYYLDATTSKPREIDLIAEKAFDLGDRWDRRRGSINVKLFIECKFIPAINVFWFDDKNQNAAKNLVVTSTPLKENNIFTDKHHYIAGSNKVAKLFAGENSRDFENEHIYKALNQCLNSMVYNQWNQTLVPENVNGYRPPILRTVEVPVILCNNFDKFYGVQMESDDSPEKIKDNFLLEVNYAYMSLNSSHRNDYFLIDVVDFEKVDMFLNAIDEDVELMLNLI